MCFYLPWSSSYRKRVLANLAVLVRDFELDLLEGTSASDEYLEQALAPEDLEDETEDSPEMQVNRMRRAVKECFPMRRCYTLPHPTNGAGAGAKTTALGSASGATSADFRRQVAAVVDVSCIRSGGWHFHRSLSAWRPPPLSSGRGGGAG